MTNEQKKAISWLEYKASQTGKTVDEIRKEMSERSNKADKSKSGFASLDKETRLKVASKGGRSAQTNRKSIEKKDGKAEG